MSAVYPGQLLDVFRTGETHTIGKHNKGLDMYYLLTEAVSVMYVVIRGSES